MLHKNDHAFTFVNIEYEHGIIFFGCAEPHLGNVNRGELHLRNVDLNLLRVFYALLGEVVYAFQPRVGAPHLAHVFVHPYQLDEQTSTSVVLKLSAFTVRRGELPVGSGKTKKRA